jgi:hypothetical protein
MGRGKTVKEETSGGGVGGRKGWGLCNLFEKKPRNEQEKPKTIKKVSEQTGYF